MAVEYNTTVVTSGLLANYDFTNRKSFTPTQNLLRYSQALTTSPWANLNCNSTGGHLAPDGTATATLYTCNGTEPTLFYQIVPTSTTGTGILTSSVYAKAATSTTFTFNTYYVLDTEVNITFTLTGAGSTSDAVNSTITLVGDGWYRCSILTPVKVNAGTDVAWRIWPTTRPTATNGLGCYFWGAQLERNSSLNDYVTTTTPSSTRSTNIIDTIGGYNMSNSYGNNAIYINTTNSFMQFTRATTAPKDGGGATVGTSGALTVTNFLYNDHTWEIWFRIDDRTPGNSIWTADATEGVSALSVYQGYHAGFTYSSTVMIYTIWNGVASGPTCASWTVGASGAQINQDSWYQMVVTRSGNVFTPYINGAPLGTGSTTVTSATGIGTSNNLWFGKAANVAAGAGAYLIYSRNSVANMKMYNRALSAEEINSNFQALRGRFGI